MGLHGVVDASRYQHRSTQNQPLRPLGGESDYDDSSLPLYLIYSKIAENENNRMIERSKNFTEGILISVSPHVSPQMTPHQLRDRVVYLLPPLVHCLRSQSPTSDRTRKTPPLSSYRTSISFKLLATQILPIRRSHLPWPNHLHSLRQDMPSG
jgi:hypothetical protein